MAAGANEGYPRQFHPQEMARHYVEWVLAAFAAVTHLEGLPSALWLVTQKHQASPFEKLERYAVGSPWAAGRPTVRWQTVEVAVAKAWKPERLAAHIAGLLARHCRRAVQAPVEVLAVEA